MLPIVEIPAAIWKGLQPCRDLFCRAAGFEHIGRYLTGLIVSPNKTLQGIRDLQAWPEDKGASSRAMHEAVFEAGRQSENLMPRRRESAGAKHNGKGRHMISPDWTQARHPRGPEIFGTWKGFDCAKGGYGLFQTALTATAANSERCDGIEAEVRHPESLPKEKAYLKAAAGQEYETLEAARTRLLELMHHELHRRRYRKITEIAVDVVCQIEDEGRFPEANYAFDNGVLCLPLSREIERRGKHWTSEQEVSRRINWKGKWRRIDEAAAELKEQNPESFRRAEFQTRTGETKVRRRFSKAVRLKRYGKKRVLFVHEQEDLDDKPRFSVTSALHREAWRILTSRDYRRPCELFHEFSWQSAGFEAAQVRKEEAVKRCFRLSSVAQTFLQDIASPVSTSEKFAFAEGQITQGQRERQVVREVLLGLLAFAQQAFSNGKTQMEVLDMLMPA